MCVWDCSVLLLSAISNVDNVYDTKSLQYSAPISQNILLINLSNDNMIFMLGLFVSFAYFYKQKPVIRFAEYLMQSLL